MTSCDVQASGTVELYYYDELSPPSARRLRGAPACLPPTAARRSTDLAAISAALAERPDRVGAAVGRLVALHGAARAIDRAINAAAERAIRAGVAPPATPRPSY